jgi:hypothetical protein
MDERVTEDADEVREIVEVSHGELAVEELGDVAKKIDAGGGEDDIVHIEKEVGHLVSPSKDEHGDIAIGSNKDEAMRVVSKALVPSPRGLLEAVEGLVKPEDECHQ